MEKKTAHQIIDETVEFYTHNPRSIVDSKNPHIPHMLAKRCVYNGPNDTHCAFARLCIDPKVLSPLEGNSAGSVLLDLGSDILKPEYRGFTKPFYSDLQRLHDLDEFWNETGLTEEGEKYVEYLKETYV